MQTRVQWTISKGLFEKKKAHKINQKEWKEIKQMMKRERSPKE